MTSEGSQAAEVASVPKFLKFVFGGCSGGLATTIIQPLDLVKTRMQNAATLMGEEGKRRGGAGGGAFSVAAAVVREEGALGLYNGLSAALLRQLTYGTTRLGLYTLLFEAFAGEDGSPPPLHTKLALGMAAGACGAAVGTPAEVALIRMTSDGALPEGRRRGYRNALDAVRRISREEGPLALWRGAAPTVGRAMVVNAAQLASYSQAKQSIQEALQREEEGVGLHFMASMVSGLVTTVASLPVDIAKTR